jgi:hypothetical protein
MLSNKFLKSISNPKLSREAASRIAQLRLTHFPVNGYLKWIEKVNRAGCPACGEDMETIEHFLLRCPNYAHKRWTLARHVRKKHKPLTIKTLLREPDLVLPLVAFIQATGRFCLQGECGTI